MAFKRDPQVDAAAAVAASRKAAAGGGTTAGGPSTNGSYVDPNSFGNYAAGGDTAGPSIPVWRTPSPTGGRAVPRGPDPFTSGVTGAPFGLFNKPGAVHGFTDPSQAPLLTADQASSEFGRLLINPDLLKQWGELAHKSIPGFSAADMNDAGQLEKAWNMAIGWSMSIAAASGNKRLLTPFEAARLVAETTGSGILATHADAAARAEAADKARAYAEAHFTGTKNLGTTTNIDKQAGTKNTEALHQLLGRNPTHGEIAAFQHGMNTTAEQNPTVTKSQGTFKDGQQLSRTDSTSGGFDEASAVRAQVAKAAPEAAANQRATTYYDALIRAIGSAV